jgi:hypothetical protein
MLSSRFTSKDKTIFHKCFSLRSWYFLAPRPGALIGFGVSLRCQTGVVR